MKTVIFLAALVAVAVGRKSYEGYRVLEVVPDNEYQIQTLRKLMLTREELDFWKEPVAVGRAVHVMVEPDLIAELSWTFELNGMRVKTFVDNVQEQIEEELIRLAQRPEERVFDYGAFNRYEDMITELDALAASCAPGYTCTTGIAGQSYEGRDLKYLTINTGASETFFIDSTIHAREWLSAATVFNIIRILLDQHPSITDGAGYATRYNWVILPLVNPDGYEFTHIDDRLWRKSRKPNTGSACVGTDLNRNFDYRWGTGGSSPLACSDTYMGEFPADNPEVQAVQTLGQSLQPFAFLTFHTYGEYWLEPYGDGTLVSNTVAHSAVTTATCAAVQSTWNEATWLCGNSFAVLYETSGTTADYMRGAVASTQFSWTPELRGPAFIVSPDQIEPSTLEVWNGLKAKMDHPSFVP